MPLLHSLVLKRALLPLCFLISSRLFCQVSLPTGALQANFPLYTYSDEVNRLSTSINLDYVLGSGLKVNEFIGCTGLGWNMQMGGVITRNQIGEPDDQKFRNMNSGKRDHLLIGVEAVDQFPDGYIYAPYNPTDRPPKVASYVPVMGNLLHAGYAMNIDDREQDIFTFQIGTKIGQFVIGRNKDVEVIQDGNLEVRFEEADMIDQKIRTQITAFVITGEDGIEYRFAAWEVTDLFRYRETQRVLNVHSIVKPYELFTGTPNKVITKWFLSEIRNPMTGKKIQFNYQSYNMDIADKLINVSQQTIDPNGSKWYGVQALHHRSRFQTQRLTSIVMPDKHSVSFEYGFERKDLPGERALTKINVKYDGQVLYGYEMRYNYLYAHDFYPLNADFSQIEDMRYVRLCMLGFRKFGSNGAVFPAHDFTYDLPTIPENGVHASIGRTTSMVYDHWGHPAWVSTIEDHPFGPPYSYFNGQDKICRFETDPVKAKWGMLKSVKYPEGGSLSYTFEPNQSESSPYLNKYSGGMRVSSTTLYDGIDHQNDIVTLYKYVKEDGTSSLWGFEMPRYSEYRTMRVYQKGDKSFVANFKSMASKYVVTAFSSAPYSMAGGGGVGAMMTGGGGEALIVALAINYTLDIIQLIFGPNFVEHPLKITYNDNINLRNPLPMMYSRVEVIEKKGQDGTNLITNGKTVYTFTSNAEYPFLIPGPMELPYSVGKRRFAHWLYGHPLTITEYNKDNQPVKKIINQYDDFVREIPGNNFLSKAYAPQNILVGPDNKADENTEDQFLTVDAYQPIQGRIELKTSTEIIYNASGGSTASTSHYTYNPINFRVKTFSTTNSKGETIGSTTYYNCDYDINGAINDMRAKNILNAPVSILNWKKSPSDNKRKLLRQEVMEYGKIDNGDYKTIKTWKSRIKVPVENSIAEEENFSPTNLTDYDFLHQVDTKMYTDGQLSQEVIVEGGHHACYLYDYDKKFVVATVKNATINEVRYTSFEAEGTGGWSFQPANIVEALSPTGRKSYDLSKGDISTVVHMAPKPIIISLWSNTAGVQLSVGGNQISSIKRELINGWQYFEYEVASISSTQEVVISGNAMVDEVRLYPKGSGILTTTYKPGVGKESECDLNGKIVYYEYDALGRIYKIKDQYRNLLKLYEYNFKQ